MNKFDTSYVSKHKYTSVKNMRGVFENFHVGKGMHQGLDISLYFFSVIMNKVTKEIPGTMVYDVC